MRFRRSFAFSLVALLGIGCTAPVDGADGADEQDVTSARPSADEEHACAEGTVKKNALGDTIVSCTKPFTDGAPLHLPADRASGDTIAFYGGITAPTDASDTFVVWSRDGRRFVPVDEHGAGISFGRGRGLPNALHAPTNRVTFTVYELSGTPGAAMETPYGPATAIRLVGARPVVEIDGCTFDSRLAGTWEGTVSERLATPQGGGPFAKAFDDGKRLPIHVTLDVTQRFGSLQEYDGHSATDQPTYKLTGTIDNFDRDVDDGGKHYPSLAAMGDANPFKGATSGKIELYRLGNMHGIQNDGHWVFTYPVGTQSISGNGMSFTLAALSASSFLTHAPALDRIEIKPHIPFTMNGHSIVLAPLAVGAKTGQCPR